MAVDSLAVSETAVPLWLVLNEVEVETELLVVKLAEVCRFSIFGAG